MSHKLANGMKMWKEIGNIIIFPEQTYGMPLKDRWRKWKEKEEEEHSS